MSSLLRRLPPPQLSLVCLIILPHCHVSFISNSSPTLPVSSSFLVSLQQFVNVSQFSLNIICIHNHCRYSSPVSMALFPSFSPCCHTSPPRVFPSPLSRLPPYLAVSRVSPAVRPPPRWPTLRDTSPSRSHARPTRLHKQSMPRGWYGFPIDHAAPAPPGPQARPSIQARAGAGRCNQRSPP